ncbi:PREDICTED: uncharacterized protein LOC106108392 [Papilio polytes]|uniref:uncharacterized protein LOC106108392 n=1 Tax=Papilio polytes TaxID=76194 RepID=UPI00067620D8|nr:PREDICTED: uncharacterized protein LOC106108392 [Papilio polytes]
MTKFLKTLHAIISLIPVFGLQYVSQPFRPPPGSAAEITLEKVIAILTSNQGVIVFILYLVLNCEVISAIREKYRQRYANAPVDEPIPMADLPAEEPDVEITVDIEE